MGIFSRIMDKILRGRTAQPREMEQPQQGQFAPQGQTQTQQGGSATARPQSQAMAQVDVEGVLTALAAKESQKLNWRTSIVDLMKLLDMDSSLSARKELAQELGYTGDMGDSATMNIWLHKQVMTKLAQNGGKVPKEMMD